MKMYVAILRFRDKDGEQWYAYSPEMGKQFRIDRADYLNRDVIKPFVDQVLPVLPFGKFTVIQRTKVYLRDYGYAEDSLVNVIPMTFKVEEYASVYTIKRE